MDNKLQPDELRSAFKDCVPLSVKFFGISKPPTSKRIKPKSKIHSLNKPKIFLHVFLEFYQSAYGQSYEILSSQYGRHMRMAKEMCSDIEKVLTDFAIKITEHNIRVGSQKALLIALTDKYWDGKEDLPNLAWIKSSTWEHAVKSFRIQFEIEEENKHRQFIAEQNSLYSDYKSPIASTPENPFADEPQTKYEKYFTPNTD